MKNYNKIKQNSGITMVSLVITVIVIIILSGVTAGILTNKNGVLDNTKDIQKNIECTRARDDVNYLLNQYQLSELEKSAESLQNYLQNKGYSYTNLGDIIYLYKDNFEIETDIIEYKVVDVRYSNEINIITVDNVSELKAKTELKVGDNVLTKGYYTKGDNGYGYYLIEEDNGQTIDDGKFIKLTNGLVAELQIKNKQINVKQYGVYGDGVTNDTTRLQYVIQELDKDYCDTIYFPSGSFMVNGGINLSQGTYKGSKNSEILITGIDDGRECFFKNDTSIENQYIHLDSLNVCLDAQTDNSNKHFSMFRLHRTNNSVVENCNFYTSKDNSVGTTPLDLYTDNHNFLFENCTAKIYSKLDQSLNTCIGVRERYSSRSTSNIIIRNFKAEKNGKDEVLWLDAWQGTVENVEVYNCEFSDNGVGVSSVWLGANNSTSHANNIRVHDCTFIKELYSNIIISIARTERDAAGITENIYFYDNVVQVNSNLANGLAAGSSIFQINTKDKVNAESKNIFIERNTVISENATIGSVMRDRSSNYIAKVKDNVIKINKFTGDSSYYDGVFSRIGEVDGNTFSKTNGEPMQCNFLFRNCKYIHDVNTNITGNFVKDYEQGIDEKIENCNVTCNDSAVYIITNSNSLYTVNIENSNFYNSNKNLLGVWYKDLNSSKTEGEAMHFKLKNVTATSTTTSGTVDVINE